MEAKRGSRGSASEGSVAEEKRSIRLWFWDGVTEYEGEVVRADGRVVVARLGKAGGDRPPGRRRSASPIEFQRRLGGKRCLLHFRGVGEGFLLEAEVDGAQRCSIPDYELSVVLRVVSDESEHQRVLRSVDEYLNATRVRLRAG